MDCHHVWLESQLRLMIETGHEPLSSLLFPVEARMVPVEFCRTCGTLRLSHQSLFAINAAIDNMASVTVDAER